MIPTHHTQLNMVIGHPLQHTQSPILHNTIYQSLAMDAVLLAFAHPEIEPLIHAIKTLSVKLVAVTMPFKEAVLPYLDYQSEEVTALKAANTIIQRENTLFGWNTDVAGIAFALRHVNLENKRILIIGAGGAARAAAYYLYQKSILFWCNRSSDKVNPLIELFGGTFLSKQAVFHEKIDIIINTTPIGMYPHFDETPLPDYIFHPEQTVFDMVYHPEQTTLVKNAMSYQATIISGIDMFIGQGLRQVELWTDLTLNFDELYPQLKNTLLSAQTKPTKY